ncbi:Protein of unknown function [Catalinimonas alkaloidigena]|uniref:DUF3124 domain-containing protein n=1 Tax=Catalinimonas alkaloidigena TaxID=1075417 RepID=A0A1G9IJ39_9BACT|nr:DUF3124 domain-containing protein [Catalinimonas alkaloidigena]SDL25207.1 Protein of unknown function [Catalinimonas alkaloidigena]
MLMRFVIFLLGIGFVACQSATEPPAVELLPSHDYTYVDVTPADLAYREAVYVPIYSDIYYMDGTRRFLLTATLSIRNTSLTDSLYVTHVDYYDSQGELTRTYLEQTALVKPMASLEFVVEDAEHRGGAGANFLVRWGTRAASAQPVIQAVMIGARSQQGISFLTEGVVIERDSTVQSPLPE